MMTNTISQLEIQSPKRNRRLQGGWEGFFPYYAGYSEQFAQGILKSAALHPGAVVLDPWNGSGTTTYASAQLQQVAIGFDLNPVMVVVARARLLPGSEADSLEPLAKELVKASRGYRSQDTNDPLLNWFDLPTASILRSLERAVHDKSLGLLRVHAMTILFIFSANMRTHKAPISAFSKERRKAFRKRSTNYGIRSQARRKN